jgi:hypothetical protein
MINNAEQAYIKALRNTGGKLMSFKTSIRLFFEAVGGSVEIDRTTLPVLAQKPFPVFLWCNYDSSRKIGLNEFNYPYYNGRNSFSVSPLDTWLYLESFVFPKFNDPNLPPNSNAFALTCRPGDYVSKYVFNDLLTATEYYGYVIISSDAISYSALLDESNFEPVITREVLYISDNSNQYLEPLKLIKTNPFGIYTADNFAPLQNKNPDVIAQDFINMNLRMKLDRYNGIYTQNLFNTYTMIFEYKFLY